MEKELFIIRHAIAGDREEFAKTGLSDDLRPVTKKGRNKMKVIAKEFYNLESNIHIFFQSPLLRSQQTVDALKLYFKESRVTTLNSLTPTSPFKDLIQDINKVNKSKTAIVGHENHLSEFTTFLLAGKLQEPFFRYKKGGIALLRYNNRLVPGEAELKWLATPKFWVTMS